MVAFTLKEPPISVGAVEALSPTTAVQMSDNEERTITPPATVDRRADALLAMRRELDTYWVSLRGFAEMEPDQVLIALSAFTARVGEMRTHCYRDGGRLATRLRLDELEPFIEECDRQFKFHSRLQSIRELDWRMAGGSPS